MYNRGFISEMTAIGSIRGGKQVTELVVLNLTRTVFIDVGNQLFNVYSHFELVLDDPNQLLCINEACSVRLASHRDESV